MEEQTIKRIIYTINDEDGRSASVWENYGLFRIYVKAQSQYGRWMAAGYIHEKNGELEFVGSGTKAERQGYDSEFWEALEDQGIIVKR